MDKEEEKAKAVFERAREAYTEMRMHNKRKRSECTKGMRHAKEGVRACKRKKKKKKEWFAEWKKGFDFDG